jgi:hypothetical protein
VVKQLAPLPFQTKAVGSDKQQDGQRGNDRKAAQKCDEQ